jgi:Tol biopolymer transport system component
MKNKIGFLTVLLITPILSFAQSQYFGQNKQRNKANNFKVTQSPHFELYNYLTDKQVSTDFILSSEKWYKLHQEVFKLSFIKPNPIILYNTHPDFQETTAIGGELGEGTGGVTEGFRTRVVMPLMYTKRQTDHVLGHELVHAFQYQTMTYGSDSTSLQNIQNLPLFMVEGLAEYMSIGRKDSHTSMWLRDAVISNDIPSISDLISKQYKYFPYRWGQAFWAYVTAQYGDDIIRPLFKETAVYGIERAFIRSFKMDMETFSARFKKDLIQTYTEQKTDKDLQPKGQVIASEKNGSEMNVSPALSPDGNLLAYISSRNVISLDIFIVNAKTGKTVKRIESGSFGAHVDSYSFIETSGTWSPDSKKFALVVQSKGKNKIVVVDIDTGQKNELTVAGVDAFTNPAWSPDGNSIVVAGLVQGKSDLFLVNIKSKETQNLTNDEYSDIQPTWSPDGKYVYFVSDRGGIGLALEKESFKISRIDLNSQKVETLNLFEKADNMNPQLGLNNNEIYFLSDPDGFRNLYKFNTENSEITRLTNFYTGISGITMYSPAMSVASKTGEISYNFFLKGDYSIYKAKESDLLAQSTGRIINNQAAYLAPGSIINGADIVQHNISKPNVFVNVNSEDLKEVKYNPKFKLEYLANSGLGVSTSRFGTGVGGGVTALFGDMLNNNQLMATLAMNGEIQDFGGQVSYLNQKRPIQFGFSASHIPYRFYGKDSLTINFKKPLPNLNTKDLKYFQGSYNQRVVRLFLDEMSLFFIKPFSKNTRIEFGASVNKYSFNVREYPQASIIGYDSSSFSIERVIIDQNGISANPRNIKINDYDPNLKQFNLSQVYFALVGDNTTFGTVAPLNGYRYRLEIAKFSGSTEYNSVLIDARKYKYLKPFSIATRILYNGRLNPKNIENINNFNPLYLGYPWYVHGFYGSALNQQRGLINQNILSGEQLSVMNFEIRLPFTGPKKLALIEFNYLPSDINFFIDGGMAWSREKKIGKNYEFGDKSYFLNGNTNISDKIKYKVSPIFTTGVSIRVNVLGYLIVEPYLALPVYNGKKQSLVSGFNFMVPGW